MQKLVFRNAKGNEIDLTSAQSGGDWGIVDWSGLSDVSINIQSQQVPFQDGSVFLDALMQDRDIAVTVAYNDEKNLAQRYELRRELISVLNPKLGEGVLIYTNDFLSKQIKCIPNMPIFANKNSDEGGTNKADVSFHCCSPYWEDLEETEITTSLTEKGIAINTGDVPSQVEMVVETSYVKNLQIYNEANEKKLRFPEELTTRTFIDTNFGRKSVNDFGRSWKIEKDSLISKVLYIDDFNCFVGCGYNLLNSKDGKIWDIAITSIRNIKDFCFSKKYKKLVAVSEDGCVLQSVDGYNWEVVTTVNNVKLYGICFSEELELFVTVGSLSKESYIAYSSDGITWQEVTQTEYNELSKIIYVNGFNSFYAGGDSGTLIKSTDGLNWSEVSGQGVDEFEGNIDYLSYTKGMLYVCDVKSVWYTKDGTNFTLISTLDRLETTNIEYIEPLNIFITVGASVYVSTNGIEWEALPYVFENNNNFWIIYSEFLNLFVVSGNNIYTSADLNNWNVIFDVFPNNIRKANDIFFGWGLYELYKSTNGIEWEKIENITPSGYIDVSYSNTLNRFVMITNEGLWYSNDLENWTLCLEDNDVPNNIIWDGDMFVGITQGYTFISNDGITWDKVTNNVNDYHPAKIIYASELGLYFSFSRQPGEVSRLLSSQDRLYWNTHLLQYPINDITYSHNLNCLVGCSGDGKIFTTVDAENFKEINIPNVTNNLRTVMYDEEFKLCVITGEGVFITSRDLINYQVEPSGVYGDAIFINYEHLVIIGYYVTLMSYFSKSQNKIDKLSTDSDMTFNLEQGENPIRISYSSGFASVTIKHKNKYIGV